VPGGLAGVTAIAAGDSHSLALKNDGTVVAWGCGHRSYSRKRKKGVVISQSRRPGRVLASPLKDQPRRQPRTRVTRLRLFATLSDSRR
jgi:alpha-tubulin suppressor-like RCC1 family protein